MKLFTNIFSKQKKLQIDFCEKNLDRFLTENNSPNYQRFLNQNHIQFKEYSCQSKCELCKESPYAIVNGEVITAASSDELLERLKQMAAKGLKE
ncbi:uncharacterized protein YuzB (UPF0349 family) [Cytobacillus eiseniae]|uniref:Uncharacterized protein YuzB (UPF0349 family) n=1 Tax=Cytobacillus eiseniae TaxID=762947 RepID=A0ABS4R9G1_9BACI|nr:DUF1450 domain-containing protein [Cytobacillus eiseniae]MBP2239533.1 uncharacterized protein YuzB (UPF0349 family) [Cytobacillus eiseniae]